MLSKEAKLKILQAILDTQNFKSSKTYRKLLIYLVEASIKNEELKETTIAMEVFGKGSDFNSSEDSSVRVYVSNLRKKLDHYYVNEGKHEKYRIRIPKGHYNLEFAPAESKNKNKIAINYKRTVIFLSLVILALTFLLVLSYINSNNVSNDNFDELLEHVVWKNITESDNSKLIVLGNDLFFLEVIDGEETIVRKHYINTAEEFVAYKELHPEKEILSLTPYKFFPSIDISTIPILIKLLKAKDKLIVKSSSGLTTNDLLENDIVFMGSFRSLHFLRYLLRDSLFEFSANPENMYVRFHQNDSVYTFRQTGEPGKEHVDYCLFRKIPGPNKNTIYMFISFFESGITVATDYMLDDKKLNELSELMTEKFGKVPEYFDILFESKGYSRTALKNKVKFIREITSENLRIW